jgi:hypothetical protein
MYKYRKSMDDLSQSDTALLTTVNNSGSLMAMAIEMCEYLQKPQLQKRK